MTVPLGPQSNKVRYNWDESPSTVYFSMFTNVSAQVKVLWSVIVSATVYMMDLFFWPKLSLEEILNNRAMLKGIVLANSYLFITSGVSYKSALPPRRLFTSIKKWHVRPVAGTRTEYSFVRFIRFERFRTANTFLQYFRIPNDATACISFSNYHPFSLTV